MQTSKTGKRIAVILITLLVFAAGLAVFKYVLTGVDINRQFNERLEEIKDAGENVDMVFVGGSRTYRSFDPDIFDEELGLNNSTNIGTPSQRPVLSYYLLEQMLDDFNPKYVVIGVSYNGLLYEQTPHTVMFALDRLNLRNKIRCVTDHFGINKGILTMTGKSEYEANLSAGRIKHNFLYQIRYGGEPTVTEGPGAKTNGYLGAAEKMPLGGISYGYDKKPSANGLHEMDPKAYEYFDKMVQLCKSRGVDVILMSGMCSLMNIYKVKDYQQYPDFYAEYAEKNGIDYYNLNYIKDRDEIFTDDMFVDYLHLNYYGGQEVSKIFARILKDREEGKDVSHYFYKNLDELKQHVHRIPGGASKVEQDGNVLKVYAKCVHNDDVTPQYRVLVSSDPEADSNSSFREIAGWREDAEFDISTEDLAVAGTFRVEMRIGEGDENVAFSLSKYMIK